MGLFDKQRLYGGKRMQEELPEGEAFILWDLAVVAEGVELPDSSDTVDKTELIVSRESEPDKPFIVTTLSGPIRDMGYQNLRDTKGKPLADDLPCLCHWEKVETKRALSPAVVLVMERPYDKVKVPFGDFPPFSFAPITQDTNPLVAAE